MQRSLSEYLAEVRRAIPTKDRPASTDATQTAPVTTDLSEYRALNPEEHSFLTWLLGHGATGSNAFLPQLEGILAKQWCPCGCPSISLHVEGDDKIVTSPHDHMLVDLIGKVEGHLVSVTLRQRQGRLVGLELSDLEGVLGEFGLPDVNTLYLFDSPPPDPS